jgi:hypothetical protein
VSPGRSITRARCCAISSHQATDTDSPGHTSRPGQDEYPVMVDMQVIVRLQDRGALRLDHLHGQALCEPEGRGDLSITHIMRERVLTAQPACVPSKTEEPFYETCIPPAPLTRSCSSL